MAILDGIDAIFFDLDGTLLDTEWLYYRFWDEASRHFGLKLTHEELLGLRSLEVASARAFFASKTKVPYDDIKALRVSLMDGYLATFTPSLKDGAKETLEALKKRGIPCYLVTANALPKAKEIVASYHLESYFAEVISAKDCPHGKPYPDPYLKALSIAKVEPKRALVVEDSPNGCRSGKRAGCIVAMVPDLSPCPKGASFVDYPLNSLTDIIE